ATLRLAIIALWFFSVTGYLVSDRVVTRQQLSISKRRHVSLQRINEALRVQTRLFEVQAGLDPLTGVLNRKGLGDELLRRTEELGERIFPLSLVFVDIDHFKSINDRHGHSVGDEVIKDIAAVIKENIQRDDLLARW